jgi:hypothetical protein
MGPGHLGIAFAAKPIVPKAPLWALLVASEALDLLFFGFSVFGIEKAGITQVSIADGIKIVSPGLIPWSHGLFMSLVWSALASGIAYLLLRDRRASGVIGLVLFSHWVLDFLVHLPDLPLLFAGSTTVGFSLWGSGAGLIFSGILDIGLLIGGLVVYFARVKKKNNRITHIGS